jgi:ribosomal protein L16 Arg81 hydroxylase
VDDNGEAGPFRRLLDPLDPATFVAETWERRSAVLRGSSRRLDSFDVDFERFGRLLGDLPPNCIRANRVDEDGTGHYFRIEAEDWRHCFEQGHTICVNHLHLCLPGLLDLARDTRRALGLAGAVGINAYLSPAGRGFGLHLDSQSVFIIQLEGEKHWLYGTEPAATFPPEGMDAYPDAERQGFRRRFPDIPLAEPKATEWRQCLLRPGDTVYLPAGTWHQGTAGDYSLALTLTCCTRNFWSLLTPLMHRGLFMSEAWRSNLPSGVAADGSRSREKYIAERLAELKQWAATLSPSDLERVWDDVLAVEALPPI